MGVAVAGMNASVSNLFERIHKIGIKSIGRAPMGKKIPKPEPEEREEPEEEEKPEAGNDIEEAIGLRLIAIFGETEAPAGTFEYVDPRSTPTLIRLLKKDEAVDFHGAYSNDKVGRISFLLRVAYEDLPSDEEPDDLTKGSKESCRSVPTEEEVPPRILAIEDGHSKYQRMLNSRTPKLIEMSEHIAGLGSLL